MLLRVAVYCYFFLCAAHGRCNSHNRPNQGRIQDFKLGGGGALKKIAPREGRRENFWGISCEKSRFYAKKSHFSNIRGGAHEIFGVFHVKNHDFKPKKSFFPILGGGGGGRESAPANR